ncbi:hypothetical protein QTI66_31930 [Variovorax sp. J22R133]|uniref:hypothetical protein n=1 Tax=Variovorax brevis TaxID=3053503 RepID=UPI00257781B2|nr:hypothetical protein [Variovorax sp. J22R133]MDM0116747.1 hypothetical protein [Variovorax sp. J22R133]
MGDRGQFANGVTALIVTEDILRATGSPEYQTIRTHYADRVAKGSGVALLQRIDEGLIILSELDATEAAMRAFCLHPLFQADEDLIHHGQDFMNSVDADPFVILLVMEFRSRANAWPADRVQHSHDGLRMMSDGCPSAGPLEAVKHMLIADKVQHRKDFIRHHRGKHSCSDALDLYFDRWLAALDVGRDEYEELCAAIDIAKSRR